jgi:hypothetical protein
MQSVKISKYQILSHPEEKKPGDQLSINGESSFEYQIPGLECPKCTAWAEHRWLSVSCPESIKGIPELRQHRPVSIERHRIIMNNIHRELKRDSAINPGNIFQPVKLSSKVPLKDDIIWPGIGMMVVSEKAKEMFKKLDGNLIFVPTKNSLNVKSNYFSVCNVRHIGEKSRAGSHSICNICKRRIFEEDPIPLNNEIEEDVSIGILAGTLIYLVSKDTKTALERGGFTNVTFDNLEIHAIR